MIILVVGIPASGKTSLVNEAKKYIKKDVEMLEFGDIVFDFAKKIYGIQQRDDIRKLLSPEDQRKLQEMATKYILENYKDKNVILTTHFVIETSTGFKAGVTKEIADLLKPKAIVLVFSDPDKILMRRIKDETRIREKDDLERIKIHQELSLYYTIPFMYMYDTIVEIIKNDEGLLEEAAKKFAEFVNNLLS
ncbi:MAG: adenylate kinase [Nanopusillaceae archaeon]